MVPREDTTLRIGTQDVAQVTPDDRLTVLSTSTEPPGWLWVQMETTGWVAKEKVAPAPVGSGEFASTAMNPAAQAQFLAGWMAGTNAGLIHQQIQLTAEILDADPRQGQRVAGLAGQLVRQSESSIERLNELSGLVASGSGVMRLLELFRSIRGEAVALRNWAQDGSDSSARLFQDAARQTSLLLDSVQGLEAAPPAPASGPAP